MKNSSSFFMLYIAIFWLSYECTNGMPKMHGESSSNPGKMNSQKPNVSSIKGKKQVIMLMRKASWKSIRMNQKLKLGIRIENDDLDKIALEAIELFKKLQILNCLATDKKQKEISEYFDTYYYQQKQKELKEEAEKPDYPIGHCSSCPEPGFATKAVCVCCKKLNEDESEACIFCCPCICAANITLCAASFASTAIDACYWCGYESYKAGSACLNKENKKKNKKKQEKIEKHLEEITPP
ncbi:hypothetical protein niasHS_005051 [Heterodera schachtii]|uniref:Uncharacterized protein n=1 Tax=Heterodera schachtii TaxID=97005 RepID=A0ABD2JKW2_HETSC